MSDASLARTLRPILDAWDLADAHVEPCGNGLINQTYAVIERTGARRILQHLNPIFAPEIHYNIRAVTEQVARAGLLTPTLIPTARGDLWLAHGDEIWRLQTAIPGVSFDALIDPEQARAAGHLVGRWHAATSDIEHEFVALRLGIHDTPKHLAKLRAALTSETDHRLYAEVEPLGAAILRAAERLDALPECPDRIAHGDLKISNMMFAGASGAASREPLALIDLDTVAPMPLAHELGDAWRSWCNRATEDQPEARFDLELFAASLAGWEAGFGAPVSADERAALLLAPEWISLELAARFAADALLEAYFGWNAERYASRGEHNLVRARSQWSLFNALTKTRPARAKLLERLAA